ncbi:MAG: polymer-forming cytoskeletal protein [Patescibacteria group bacterium]
MIWGSIKNYSGNNPSKQSKFSASSRFDGKLVGAETIIFEGRLEGEILVNGILEITQNAEINGNIKANKLSISGKVNGNIDVAGSLSVERTAVICGDIKAGAVTIIAGAIINGQCSFGGTANNQEYDRILEQHNAVLANAY